MPFSVNLRFLEILGKISEVDLPVNQNPALVHTGVIRMRSLQYSPLLETTLYSLDLAVVVMAEVENETLFLHVTNLLT